MKRISMMALGLPLLLLLSACSRDPQPTSTATPSTAPIASSTSAATSASSVAVASVPAAVIPTDAIANGEQVTETDDAESLDNATTAQPMALRIAELKPEPASPWQEGVHYTRLVPTQPTTAAPGQVEVAEVFWYGCPHCFSLDPAIENWRKNNKPGYVSFVRIPVMWGSVHHSHARIFYTAEMLGKFDELHRPIFEEIQRRNNPLNTAASIATFFSSHGVSETDFQKAFSSFAVEASLKRAESLGLRYKVESVPLFVINGKYVTDVAKAGSPQALMTLINELASRERGT